MSSASENFLSCSFYASNISSRSEAILNYLKMGGNTMTEKILFILPGPEPKEILDRLRSKYPQSEITFVVKGFGADASGLDGRSDVQFWILSQRASYKTETDLLLDVFRDKTILFTTRFLPTGKTEGTTLKYVHLYSAGVDRILKHPLFLETNIPFTNCSGVHGPQISEWIIMTLLIQGHKYNGLHDAQKERKWNKQVAQGTRDVIGQRIGVLGYGGIGRQGWYYSIVISNDKILTNNHRLVARIASAMGMEVFAYTATEKKTPEDRADQGYFVPGIGDPDGSIPVKWFHGLDKPSLHNFLSQKLDVLVVSVPLTYVSRTIRRNL
jgi:hypothetical protein